MLTKSPEVGVDYTIPYDIRGSGDSVFPNTVEEDHDRGIKIKGWRKDELQLLLHKGLRRCRHNEENLDNEIETTSTFLQTDSLLLVSGVVLQEDMRWKVSPSLQPIVLFWPEPVPLVTWRKPPSYLCSTRGEETVTESEPAPDTAKSVRG